MRKLLFISIVGFLSLMAVFNPFKSNLPYKVSMIAIFQNEDRFLKEWIDYHRVVGVEHFYLYNNLSNDNYLAVLEPYIQQGVVELSDWPYKSKEGDEADWNRIQTAAYREGIDKAKSTSEWVAILDTDEFLLPKKHDSIPAMLEDYAACSGILVNWQVFGTSDVEKIPENELMLEHLVQQTPAHYEVNTFCKTLVRPQRVKWCWTPHDVVYYPGYYAVDTHKQIFPWKFHKSRLAQTDIVVLNHYWSRDEAFFQERKLSRYDRWGVQKEACLKRNREANQVTNTEIQRFLPKMREL